MLIMRSKISISTAQTLYITAEKHVIAILNNRKENQAKLQYKRKKRSYSGTFVSEKNTILRIIFLLMNSE
jgi:hypothetical protein